LKKHLLYTAVLLCGVTGLRADVFNFSYTGSQLSASGTLTATLVSGDTYKVTDITGQRNGSTIDGLVSQGSFDYNGSASNVSIVYDLGGIVYYDVSTDGSNTETTSILGFPVGTKNLTTFSISSVNGVPEPTGLLLLLTTGLGVCVMARKLPFKNTN
jgi:hypothetical protein